jgi:hypothetical protein
MNTVGRRQKTAQRRAWLGWRGALALAIVVASPAVAAEADLTVGVRVYNYAQVPSGVLVHAEREASRILSAAGVNTTWLDCLNPRSEAQAGSTLGKLALETNKKCDEPERGAVVLLRIVPYTAPASAVPDTMFGFATGRDMASVFYERVKDLAWGADKDGNEIPLILGNVIAHEVGHLLLGTNSHSPAGIMCANWDQEYVRQALRGHQLFSRDQSAVMKATVAHRNQEIVQP